jgi:hypothetical protein
MSFKRYKCGRFLKLNYDKDSYLRVCLINNDNEEKTHKVHRLVAKEFIENSNSNILIEINHIDENKENNNISNLEWCSSQYNIEYSQSKNYKILFPDGHEEIIFNLCKFCRENNLQQRNMINTLQNNYFHKGFKILKKEKK